MKTVALLFCSNIFMTFAWYGHLKDLNTKPLVLAILASWGIAFFEYVLQVPANRIGFRHFSLAWSAFPAGVRREAVETGVYARRATEGPGGVV